MISWQIFVALPFVMTSDFYNTNTKWISFRQILKIFQTEGEHTTWKSYIMMAKFFGGDGKGGIGRGA
jgi:hypothetical protein